MDYKQGATLAFGLFVSTLAFCQDDESDRRRAQDRSAYVINLTSEPMKELCSAVVKGYSKSFAEAYPRWAEQHKDSIQRGREETTLSLGRGGSIEAYETSMLEELGKNFAAMPKERQQTRCLGTLRTYAASP